MQLNRDWIAARIPHQGAMCLLDGVVAWDEKQIRCAAISHRDIDNPLRAHGRLAAACGIEYAAQAMAVHGALLAAADEGLKQGYLVSVRGTQFHVARLDNLVADLTVEAERLGGDGNNILYRFAVRADERLLLDGRATVVLNAEVRGKPA